MVIQLAPPIEHMNLALQGRDCFYTQISLTRRCDAPACRTLSPDIARKFPRGLQLKDALAKPN